MNTRIKRGAAVWGTVLVLLFAWSGISAGANASEEGRFKDDVAESQKREHFYRVIAGDLPGNESGPANKLANDLQALPADELSDFRGDSNRYGGITDDLGFDPFNSPDCSECGPLDADIVLDVEQIKASESGLTTVLEERASQIEQPDTTFGPPGWLIALWILAFPTYAGVLYLRQRSQVIDRYREFPEERHLIAQLREAQHELPPGNQEWLALDQLADQLQEQIDTRVDYHKSKAQQVKLETLTKEAANRLDDIAAGNKTLD